MSDVTFIAGCFAYAKQPGHPYWPCVVYNRWDEIPPEHAGRLKKPLTSKEDEVIVFWIEDWNFSVVKKANVKATHEVEEAVVLKGAKSSGMRKRLAAAIASMKEMEQATTEGDDGVEAAVIRPGQQPPAPSPVPMPELPVATAAPVEAGRGKKKAAAGGGGKGKVEVGNAAEAGAAAAEAGGGKKKPAAANNKKRKQANDGAAPVEEAPAAAAALAPAATKQPAKRSKSGCGGGKVVAQQQADGAVAAAGAAGGAAPAASKGKRKLSAGAAAAAIPQQQQEGAAAAAVAVAGDSGKNKARKPSSTPRAPRQPKAKATGGQHLPQLQQQAVQPMAPMAMTGQEAAYGHARQDSETMAAAALVGLSPEPKHQHQQDAFAQHHPHHAYAYQHYYGYPPHQQPYAMAGATPMAPLLPSSAQAGPPPGPPYALPVVPAVMPMGRSPALEQPPQQQPPPSSKKASKSGSGGGGGRARKASSITPSPAEAGGAAAAEGSPTTPPAPAGAAPTAVEEDTQENPFLAPWKEMNPTALAKGMQSYAVWAPGAFSGFAPDDTRPAPGDEAWANGGEGVPGREGRPGRKASGRKSMRVSDRLHEIQQGRLPPHTLLICEEYGLKADGGVNVQGGQGVSAHHATAAQPFHVKVHPDVAFLCDLHAHLADSEIIGFLAGRFDAAARTLFVQAPFPCRATARNDDGSTDVEMDPGSEIEVRDVIDRSQMTVVGWYHSHPTFAPEPSLIDIENQANYQQLMREESMGAEPFVGLIVGTYDDSVKQPVSLFRYFHVRRIKLSSTGKGADAGVNFPMAMEVYVGHNNNDDGGQQQKEEEGMDLLASVTSNLPSLPTRPAAGGGEGEYVKVAGKEEEGGRAGAAATNGAATAAATASSTPAVHAEQEPPKAEEGTAAVAADGAPAVPSPPLAVAPAPALPPGNGGRAQSVFLAVNEKQHRALPPSKEIWARIEATFLSPSSSNNNNNNINSNNNDHLPALRCTLETVRLLVNYYSRLATRVDFEEEWRRGTSKGEKFELSLRKRVAALPGLGPDPQRRQAFLEALLEFIVAAWVEGTPRRLPQPEDFSGTRRERQKQAAAAREAVLAADQAKAAAVAAAAEEGAGGEAGEPGPVVDGAATGATTAVEAAAAPEKVPSIPPPPPPLEEEEAAQQQQQPQQPQQQQQEAPPASPPVAAPQPQPQQATSAPSPPPQQEYIPI